MKPYVIKEAYETAEPFQLWPELIPLDEPDLPALDPGLLPSCGRRTERFSQFVLPWR